MLYWIKRHPGESMMAAGGCLLFAAACWHDLAGWDIYGGQTWFRDMGFPVAAIGFMLSAVAGLLVVICGATWLLIRRWNRQNGQ